VPAGAFNLHDKPGHSLHKHENDARDGVKEDEDTFVKLAFRKKYDLTDAEKESCKQEVLADTARDHSQYSFAFRCQVCGDEVQVLWSGERLAHFREKHPHLIREILEDQPGASEDEIFLRLKPNFILVLASVYCSLCEDENAPDGQGFVDVLSSGHEPESWDGADYLCFLNWSRHDRNHHAMIDHLWAHHSKIVKAEIKWSLQILDPDFWSKQDAKKRRQSCKINHRRWALEKAASMMAELQVVDHGLRSRGNPWGAADAPWTFKCPGCDKPINLRIS
jgi:hypothetical protein